MAKQLEHVSTVSSSFCEFKLSLIETQDAQLLSKRVFTDAHHPSWVVYCLPRGEDEDNGEYVSLFVLLVNSNEADSAGDENEYSTGNVPFLFQAFVAGSNADADADADAISSGGPATMAKLHRQIYGRTVGQLIGWRQFLKRSVLESLQATNGIVTIVCGVMFLPGDDSIVTVAPSTMAFDDLRRMLADISDVPDVSFLALLAERSPDFREDLYYFMEDPTVPFITLQDTAPAAFRILLRCMYHDTLPPPPSEASYLVSTTELRRVLAGADRYGYTSLKLTCARKLCESLSVDTVAANLECAEMHGCSELKKRCLEFFMEEENFKKVVVTEGYMQLMQRSPSVIDEIKELTET